jgi:hypothetical protein
MPGFLTTFFGLCLKAAAYVSMMSMVMNNFLLSYKCKTC